MSEVYALLVGIDAYLPPVNALYGCRNDMAAFEQYLTARVGKRLRPVTLYDEQATRAAVIDTFRSHLGQAGRGDVALFAYAGHGSEEPAPAAVMAMEPSGRIQTLMVQDCGRRVDGKLIRAIADKELAVLIGEVSDRGAHTVVILDCCHSGGGTRDPQSSVRGWEARPETADATERALVEALAEARPDGDLLAGALTRWPSPPAAHVALAACHSFEKAKEHRVGETTRGAFSVGLIGALETLGERTTYRSLLNTVRARVARTAEAQVPELWPLEPGSLGDALFLDGTVTPVPATFTMSKGFDGWELDAGLVHGLRPPAGDDEFVVACTAPGATTAAGVAKVTTVEIGRSMVEPVGWEPDDVAYAAVITDVPLPPAEVQFDAPEDGVELAVVERVTAAITDAIAVAGPGGGPSPHVHVVVDAPDVGALRLRVAVTADGAARIARADGTPILPDVPLKDEGAARLVVAQLEHVARWEQVRSLGDQPSPLADAIVLDVFAAEEGETTRPADRHALAAAAGYTVRYAKATDGSWAAPRVFVEMRNTTPDQLFVAVLDLTDRFRCSPLFQTSRVAPGQMVALNGGAALSVTLPEGRAVEEGRLARDWLKVVVSDVEFDASAFDLPALGERPLEKVSTRSLTTWGTLERLAAKAISRDVGVTGVPAPVAARWAATTVLLETVVGGG